MLIIFIYQKIILFLFYFFCIQMSQHEQDIRNNGEISYSSTQSVSELIPKQQQIKNPQRDSKIKMKSIPARTIIKEIYKHQNILDNNDHKHQINNQAISQQKIDQGLEKILSDSKMSISSKKSLPHQQENSSFSFDFSSQAKKQGQRQRQIQIQRQSRVSSDSSKEKQQQIQNLIKQIKIIKKSAEIGKKQNNGTIKNNLNLFNNEQMINSLKKELLQKNDTILQLQKMINTEVDQNKVQKQANQIYTQFYHDLVKVVVSRNKAFKQMQITMENVIKIITEKFDQNIQKHKKIQNNQSSQRDSLNENVKIEYQSRIEQLNLIINNCDDKISQLRNQLVKSTQNNINAIFNTQISASRCLQHEIQKINFQLSHLKMNINQVSNSSKNNWPNLVHLQPPLAPNKDSTKIVKIYKYSHQSDSDSDSSNNQYYKKNSRRSKKKHLRSNSSASQKARQQLEIQQNKNKKTIQELKLSYVEIKQQYNNLFKTLKLIYKDQQIHKQQFKALNTQLLNDIKTHFQKISQKQQINIIKYEEQKKLDKKIIQQLNSKFAQLICAISVPQKLNKQNLQDQAEYIPYSQISLSVDHIRKLQLLQNQNAKLCYQMNKLEKQNIFLQEKVQQINNRYDGLHIKARRESIINKLKGLTNLQIQSQNYISSQNQFHQSNLHKNLETEKNYIAHEQLRIPYKKEGIELIDMNKTNKTNYHVVLKDKNKQIKFLTEQLHYLQQIVRDRQSKIHQLQILLSNLQNRHFVGQNNTNNILAQSHDFEQQRHVNDSKSIIYSSGQSKQKYQAYIQNLKLLLKDSRKQNANLKLQLQQIFNEQRADCRTETIDIMKNSAAQSDRTAKNYPTNNSPKKGEVSIKRRTQQEQAYSPLLGNNEEILSYHKTVIDLLGSIIQLLNEIDFQDRQTVHRNVQQLIRNLKHNNSLVWQNICKSQVVQKLIKFLQQSQIHQNL